MVQYVSSPLCASVSCVTGSVKLCLCICLCACCTHHDVRHTIFKVQLGQKKVLCQDVMFVCVCDVCFCLRDVFVCFRLRGGVQYSNLQGAVGPWESFGRCSPPVMPFLLRSVLIIILKFFFLKSALSPKSFMTSIILQVIIVNARSCSWRTSGLVTLPHLGARETLVFGVGAQTGCHRHPSQQ